MKKVFVSGASGYVGSAVCRELVAEGKDVVGFSRSGAGGNVALDITTPVLGELPAKAGGSVLVHSAASMNVGDRDSLWSTNVDGTYHLLNWALQAKLDHVVLISTGGVYPYRNDHAWKEDEETDPIGPYGYSKFIAEETARMFSRDYGLSVTVLRLFFPFDLEGEGGMGRLFVSRLNSGLPFQIRPEGKPGMNPIYLLDFVDLVKNVVENGPPSCGFEIYNAGGAEVISFLEMAQYFEKVVGKEAVIERIDEPQEDLIGSIDKAKCAFDWEPKFNF